MVVRDNPRRWAAVAGVAVCLGLAGVVTGIVVAQRQKVSDAHITSDALQREELRDGWKTLGAAAAREAQANNLQPLPATSAAPAAAPTVVVVNVPAPSAASAPSNVTNITVPSGGNGAPIDTSGMAPGYSTVQSVPGTSYSPVQGYLPAPTNYAPPAANSAAQQPNLVPQNSYGTTNGTAAPPAQAVGNGSIPGSTPNPALPNNGLVGTTPTPGLPNGTINASPTPNAPVGVVPASP